MSDPLDRAYAAQRRRLTALTSAAAVRAWARSFHSREEAIAAMAGLVGAGQRQMAALVDAYMAAKGGTRVKGLPVPEPRDLRAVYERPFGALGGQLEAGAGFTAAMASAQARVGKLAATDMQLAQTHSAREWMSGDQRIAGYERLISSGNPCGLCVAASTQRYNTEDLCPIHDSCSCDVSPIFGEGPMPQTINPERWEIVKSQASGDLSAEHLSSLNFDRANLPDVVRAVPDPELGLRLVDSTWAAAA
jgi:hypothetical protein